MIPKPSNTSQIKSPPESSRRSPDEQTKSNNKLTSFRPLDLNELINNARDLEQFKCFLEHHGALTDLLCWMDIEAYLRLDANDYARIEDAARALKRHYLNKKYLFSSTKSPIDANTQNIVIVA